MSGKNKIHSISAELDATFGKEGSETREQALQEAYPARDFLYGIIMNT